MHSPTVIFSYGCALDEPIPKKPELSMNELEREKWASSPSYIKNARLDPYTSLSVGGTALKQKYTSSSGSAFPDIFSIYHQHYQNHASADWNIGSV